MLTNICVNVYIYLWDCACLGSELRRLSVSEGPGDGVPSGIPGSTLGSVLLQPPTSQHWISSCTFRGSLLSDFQFYSRQNQWMTNWKLDNWKTPKVKYDPAIILGVSQVTKVTLKKMSYHSCQNPPLNIFLPHLLLWEVDRSGNIYGCFLGWEKRKNTVKGL